MSVTLSPGSPRAHRRAFFMRAAVATLLAQSGPWALAQAPAAPPPAILATAINRAGRFRALSQRIAKAYCQIHLNVDPSDARQVLETARRLVRAGFDDLAKSPWHIDIASQLADIRTLFEGLDALLVMPPTREAVAAASAQADKMLAAANSATETFEKLFKTASGALVNTAGRQRYLSQRLAKNYFLLAAGMDGKAVREQMVADAAAFKQGMASLAAASVTNAAIRGELLMGEQQWIFFSAALDRAPDMRGLRAVATASERLLEVMNNLTVQYETAVR